MGHIYVEAVFSNPEKPKLRVKARALVDTGASFTVLPKSIADKLGLDLLGKVSVKTAMGEQELDEVEARIGVTDRERITPSLVSEQLEFPLIGVVTLEILRLKVDPTTGRVEELPLLLY